MERELEALERTLTKSLLGRERQISKTQTSLVMPFPPKMIDHEEELMMPDVQLLVDEVMDGLGYVCSAEWDHTRAQFTSPDSALSVSSYVFGKIPHLYVGLEKNP